MSQLLQHAAAFLTATPVRGVTPMALASVLGATTLRRHNEGDVLCAEGDPGNELFFLMDGNIRVSRKDSRGVDRELAVLSAPALLGHMSLVDKSPRSATCATLGRAVVGVLDRRRYNSLLTEPSERGMALRRVLCASLTRQLVGANERVRALLQQAEAQTSLDPDDVDDVEDYDVSDTGLLGLESALGGWNTSVTAADLDAVEFVMDEDQKRNPRNRR